MYMIGTLYIKTLLRKIMVIYPNTKIDGMFDILFLSNTFSNSLSTINVKSRRDKMNMKAFHWRTIKRSQITKTYLGNANQHFSGIHSLLHLLNIIWYNKEKLLSVLEFIDDWDKNETFSIHISCLSFIHISKVLDFIQFIPNFIIRYYH